MTWVHEPNPQCVQWWKLTESGAEVVEKLIDCKFNGKGLDVEALDRGFCYQSENQANIELARNIIENT